jgi:hypothetical protein
LPSSAHEPAVSSRSTRRHVMVAAARLWSRWGRQGRLPRRYPPPGYGSGGGGGGAFPAATRRQAMVAVGEAGAPPPAVAGTRLDLCLNGAGGWDMRP